jgi:type II secretory pathway component GspD/PulD (secretin)
MMNLHFLSQFYPVALARRLVVLMLAALWTISPALADPDLVAEDGAEPAPVKQSAAIVKPDTHFSMSMNDAQLSEVMNMLSRQHRVSIFMADEIDTSVSFSIYDLELDDAIRSIATAAGFVVEQRGGKYFILKPEDAGKTADSDFTTVRAFPLQYADAADLESKLSDYLSEFGQITALPDNKLLLIEDQPAYVRRIAVIMAELDNEPRQVMIEARILEVQLNAEESYGIDWTDFFDAGDGTGSFGLQGLSETGNAGSTGFFFDFLDPSYEVALRALESDGRLKNLASPKIVTVEDEEAEVVIGSRLGYPVTTTINQVTSETIEFLESGVILRVTSSIDADDRIMVSIHPEVSNGVVDDRGIPNQTTTEVTTRLVVQSGQSIFIGGLISNSTTAGTAGVPILGKIPGLRWAFSNKSERIQNTETVVIITPRLLDAEFGKINDEIVAKIERISQEAEVHSVDINATMDNLFVPPSDGLGPAATPAERLFLDEPELPQ